MSDTHLICKNKSHRVWRSSRPPNPPIVWNTHIACRKQQLLTCADVPYNFRVKNCMASQPRESDPALPKTNVIVRRQNDHVESMGNAHGEHYAMTCHASYLPCSTWLRMLNQFQNSIPENTSIVQRVLHTSPTPKRWLLTKKWFLTSAWNSQ